MPPIWPIPCYTVIESGKLQRSQNFKDLSARIRGSWRFSLGIVHPHMVGKRSTLHTCPAWLRMNNYPIRIKQHCLLISITLLKLNHILVTGLLLYTENLMDRQNNTLRLPICTLWCSNLWKSFFETNWKTDLNSQSVKRKACVTFGIFR